MVQFLIYFRAITLIKYNSDMRKLIIAVTFILTIGSMYSCFNAGESTLTGVVAGDVILEPMCPDEPCDLDPKELEALYTPRKILIYSADTSEVIQRVGISIDGEFATSLPVGDYIIDINYYENDISRDTPATLTIVDGFISNRTIHIATGL